MDYVINNTIILHFCGKKKPWHKNTVVNFIHYTSIMKNSISLRSNENENRKGFFKGFTR